MKDKLTIEECEEMLSGASLTSPYNTRILGQLLDLMRENEHLKSQLYVQEALSGALKQENKQLKTENTELWSRLSQAANQAMQQSRDWNCEHGVPHKQCGSCYSQKEPPIIEGLCGKVRMPYAEEVEMLRWKHSNISPDIK